jgi:hypothetical protein
MTSSEQARAKRPGNCGRPHPQPYCTCLMCHSAQARMDALADAETLRWALPERGPYCGPIEDLASAIYRTRYAFMASSDLKRLVMQDARRAFRAVPGLRGEE